MAKRAAAAVVLAAALLVRPAPARPLDRPGRPTRATLLAQRARVARLESEFALTSTRKPHLVLDLGRRTLTFRLMGMTVREVPFLAVDVRGLRPVSRRGDAPARFLAGIFRLGEKEGDPRLSPLTPEQVEAGLDDENAADVLPPEPPSRYVLFFSQPLSVRVEGLSKTGVIGRAWSAFRSRLPGLFRWSGHAREREAAVRVSLHLDETTAREVYRSLVPDELWVVVPPLGMILPEAGQESPPKPRPVRPAPRRAPPPVSAPGIPFQIPPPLEEIPPPGPGEPPVSSVTPETDPGADG